MITNTENRRFGLGRVMLDATAEARLRGDRTVGTEHLVLALLNDPGSLSARALGVDLPAAREALNQLDEVALAALGITTADLGRSAAIKNSNRRLRLTPAAGRAFISSRRLAVGERLGPQHILLGLLLNQRPDPAAELLDLLGIDRDQVRARIRQP